MAAVFNTTLSIRLSTRRPRVGSPLPWAFAWLVWMGVAASASAAEPRDLGEFNFDQQGRLVARTYPDGTRFKAGYDAEHRLSRVEFDDYSVQVAYDANGNRISVQDARGVIDYYFDAFDRLIGVLYKDVPWKLVLMDYGPKGPVRRLSIYDLQALRAEPAYRQRLDTLWALPREGAPDLARRQKQFMDLRRKLQAESADQTRRWLQYQIEYEFDIFGRLRSMRLPEGELRYTYDLARREVRRHLPNGYTSVLHYDPGGLLDSIQHRDASGRSLVRYHYARNVTNEFSVVRESEAAGSERVTIYDWDLAGRLRQVFLPDSQKLRFNYDALGRLQTLRQEGRSTSYRYNIYGRPSRVGSADYHWSKGGALAAYPGPDGPIRVRYNERRQPVEFRGAELDYALRWNAAGNLVADAQGDDTRYWLPHPLGPDGQNVSLAEFDETGALAAVYLYADGLVGRREADGALSFYLEDGYQAVRYVVDAGGAVRARIDYSPLGEPQVRSGHLPDMLRPGERYYPHLGLSQHRDRFYRPGIGAIHRPRRWPQLGESKMPAAASLKDVVTKQVLDASLESLGPQLSPAYRHAYAAAQRFRTADWWARAPLNLLPGRFGFGAELAGGMRGAGTRQSIHGAPRTPAKTPAQGASPRDAFAQLTWALSRVQERLHDVVTPMVQRYRLGLHAASGFILSHEPTARALHGGIERLWLDGRSRFEFFRGPFAGIGVLEPVVVEELDASLSQLIYGIKPAVVEGLVAAAQPYLHLFPARVPNPAALQPAAGLAEGSRAEEAKQVRDSRSASAAVTLPFAARNVMSDPFADLEYALQAVRLGETTSFTALLGNIVGAVYEPEAGVLVLLADRTVPWRALRPEDFAVPITAIWAGAEAVRFSLEPLDPKQPRAAWLKAVYEPDAMIADTEFGNALFAADWLLKQYAVGVRLDEEGKLLKRDVPVADFKSIADLMLEQASAGYSNEHWARYWIAPHQVILRRSDYAVFFQAVHMQVKANVLHPPAENQSSLQWPATQDVVSAEFTERFSRSYDEIAAQSLEFEHIRQTAKVLALVKWLKQLDVPMDQEWIQRHATPKVRAVRRVPALSIERPAKPGGGEGAQRRIRVFGGIDLDVRPEYRADDGRLARLQSEIYAQLKNPRTAPVFTVQGYEGPLSAVVTPLTRAGQAIWERSPVFEVGGNDFRYNAQGVPIELLDAKGNKFEFSYDTAGRLIQVQEMRPGGWSLAGRRIDGGSFWVVRTPRGNQFRYDYDESGILQRLLVDGEPWATYHFDAGEGRLGVSYGDFLERLEFTPHGDLLSYGAGPDADQLSIVRFEYDKLLRLRALRQDDQQLMRFEYESNSVRPRQLHTPGSKLVFTYDRRGDLRKVERAPGAVLRLERQGTALSRVELMNHGGREAYTFDQGRLVEVKDFAGAKLQYFYLQGRLDSVSHSVYGAVRFRYNERGLERVRFGDGSGLEFRHRTAATGGPGVAAYFHSAPPAGSNKSPVSAVEPKSPPP